MTRDLRTTDQRGVVLPVLALSLVALLSVAALVIDGGQAYSQRRQMQNAADAAAMAGTAKLDDLRFTRPLPAGTIWQDVQGEVDRISLNTNGAEQVLLCAIIDSAGNEIGPCSDQSAVMHADAVGVTVKVEDSRDTLFGGVVGVETLSATADAAAAVQPIVGGEAPWAICSSGNKYDILTPDFKIDPVKAAALGEFVIQGAQVYKDDDECAAKKAGGGGAASFKGPIDDVVVKVGPNTLAESDPGNNLPSGWEQHLITCQNAPKTNACILLPVAYKVEGVGTNANIYIADFAFFRVREGSTGNDELLGTFERIAGPGEVPGSLKGEGKPEVNDARTVSLVE